jgi:LAO/AO transport system kinase
MAELDEEIISGDRRALARAITLVESGRPDHRAEAEELLARLLPHTGRSVRVGISGTPGVGKSTFIEALGGQLTESGSTVAVLAVDPSSARTGGSILGDKTRMEELARNPLAYIRPTPSKGSLGGVARRTREAMLVCEAAGYDTVLVETVGVGQSETAVADMVDAFVVLIAPAGGDELQGIKRGVMELADIVVVNKADGELLRVARLAQADYTGALHLMRPKSETWTPEVLLASSAEGTGIHEVWECIERHQRALEESGRLSVLREDQALAWMWSEVEDQLHDALRAAPAVAASVESVEASVRDGACTPSAGARRLLEAFRAES